MRGRNPSASRADKRQVGLLPGGPTGQSLPLSCQAINPVAGSSKLNFLWDGKTFSCLWLEGRSQPPKLLSASTPQGNGLDDFSGFKSGRETTVSNLQLRTLWEASATSGPQAVSPN